MNPSSRVRWVRVLITVPLVIGLVLQGLSFIAHAKKKKDDRGVPVLWSDPGNLRRRDLYWGPGSRELAPKPPFRFVKEDLEGGMPKFEVKDANDVKWHVKLGPEAQSETVSTRLVWAVGYNAEESYYFDRVHVNGMQPLSRGRQYVFGETVRGARFEPRRKNVERGEQWGWSKNPFKHRRELDGLKTIMVLLNNWDVFKKNNRILRVQNDSGTIEDRYTVTDLGATLGSAGGFAGRHRSKNNLQDFQRYRMVRKVEDGKVKYDYNLRPKGLGLVTIAYPPYFFRQRKATNAVNHVPVESALWIGLKLAQLSDDQLRDSFRAAGYDRATTEGYVRTLRQRINELNEASQSELVSRPRRAGGKIRPRLEGASTSQSP